MLSIRHINEHINIGQLDLTVFAAEHGVTLKRDIERAGTRYLLKELLNTNDYQLCYDEFSKPYLQGRKEHISISHSHDKLVIITNTKESTGIDIELIREKVTNIQHKFLNEVELAYAKDHVDKLITIWAAKEAIFKAHGKRELEFSSHIVIENPQGQRLKGEIRLGDFQRSYELKVETIDQYRMVYVMHEI